MRNQVKHYAIKGILCLTLLFTMGLDFGISNHNPTDAASVPSAVSDTSTSTIDYQPPFTPRQHPPLEFTGGQATSPAPHNVTQPKDVIEPVPSIESAAVYEVTAYFLNVRAAAANTSEILDVVSQGSVLEVVRPTDNGWLELKSGGYVHGKYAKAIAASGETKKSSAVSILSAEPSASKAVAAEPSPESKKPEDSPSKPTSSVTSDSGLTEAHIAELFEGTPLEGQGLEKAVLAVEEEYGINSYFIIAVMKLESGHGKSKIAKNKNNLFGLNASGKNPYKNALSFETKGESVEKFGQIIADFYVDKGLTSVEKVARKYCPSNSKWPSLVKNIMNRDYKKVA
ncbi:glucosaminidase domain-containing protein [Paenibacillus sp.]|uniref:glucosaminidase domain-containing protein n=1 Tax=Paenibacillus sp. TaxID=58172 RepID=UPI002811FBE8|nr:glucosaminidase domain-containing protein [Paenibacillus sp.]